MTLDTPFKELEEIKEYLRLIIRICGRLELDCEKCDLFYDEKYGCSAIALRKKIEDDFKRIILDPHHGE